MTGLVNDPVPMRGEPARGYCKEAGVAFLNFILEGYPDVVEDFLTENFSDYLEFLEEGFYSV